MSDWTLRQQPVAFLLDHQVALAAQTFDFKAIEHRDLTAPVHDRAVILQLARSLCHALATHPKHIGDQLLCHAELVANQAVQRQQQPATQLLIN
jgi:hypothetical protein